MPPIFSTRFAVLIRLDLITFDFFSGNFPTFSSLPVDSIRPPLPPCTLPSLSDSVMVSDGLVGVAVGSRPLVRVLIAVLQLIGEVGIGVSVVSLASGGFTIRRDGVDGSFFCSAGWHFREGLARDAIVLF